MIYNVGGTSLLNAFDISGEQLGEAYDVDGNEVFSGWGEEISIEEFRNTTTGTTYYIVHIPQTRPNGQKQYPFVYAPNGTGVATQSTLEMNRQHKFYMAINAGVFEMPSSGLYTPVGTIVQNSVVIKQGSEQELSHHPSWQYAFTIDDEGWLGYADRYASASEMTEQGIVSAVQSFTPVIINHVDAYEITHSAVLENTSDAQRQIIGQYDNGDYCILTCEGRGFKDSVGFTMPQIREMCLDMGLKFAFMLDGGGSTETVIGDEQINTIYEGTYGRKVPTFIVFNGTDEFFVPNA